MPPKRRGSGQRSAPKQFRCTGYGDCNMVFTRSEHLARHERKHTGEKPYKCVVDGCGRMFSRFDNMMQHTQTHEKEKKKSSTPTEVPEDYTKLKKARASMTGNPVTESPIQMQEESFPWHQQDSYQIPPLEYTHMVYNRTLPPPYRRSSIAVPSEGCRSSYPYSFAKPHFYHPSHFPPPVSDGRYRKVHMNRSSWPTRRDGYDESEQTRRSSISTASTDSGHVNSPPSVTHEFNVKRRISVDALQTPIEKLRTIQLDEKPIEKDAVDITQDEYEALEAFSQFHSSSVIDSSPRESPTLSMRQRLPTSRMSYSRPVSHNYIS